MKKPKEAYLDFIRRFSLLIAKNPHLIVTTLSNIFTMRLIGNKTHGDLAEIGMAEFINQFMYDFRSIHVGKDLFRSKQSEEDIQIINEIDNSAFTVSLKAYGDGPLQLSTDKSSKMFVMLERYGSLIEDSEKIVSVMSDPAFDSFSNINVMPLIYDEKSKRCNIMVFDYERAKNSVTKITRLIEGNGRKHPVYRFTDGQNGYVCEVRYGGASANALQRGFWTNTRNASRYFDSLTGGWIGYSLNPIIVKLFACALLSTRVGHQVALEKLQEDVDAQKVTSTLSGSARDAS